jgi:hypothetical protein
MARLERQTCGMVRQRTMSGRLLYGVSVWKAIFLRTGTHRPGRRTRGLVELP